MMPDRHNYVFVILYPWKTWSLYLNIKS